jgi:hypothetical protein
VIEWVLYSKLELQVMQQKEQADELGEVVEESLVLVI